MLDEYGFELYEENDYPQGYLITFCTYGTWLHGDERGSVGRNGLNVYGMPRLTTNWGLESSMKKEMKGEPVVLDREKRDVVGAAVKELCQRRLYQLQADYVGANHAHIVLTAQRKPERIAMELKANATKMLREAGLIATNERIWSRGGSHRYLWKPRHVSAAVSYVLYGQGDTEFVSAE